MDAEGQLDPWVEQWIEDNPLLSTPFDDLDADLLELARSPAGFPVTRDVAHVADDSVGDVPIRVYRPDAPTSGLLVYFHGGGFCVGSIGLMDNVARELASCSGCVVVSVGYRLAPEHPYPAGLDDCVSVTRWARENAERLGATGPAVVVGGESAGGNLAAATSLSLRDAGDPPLAGQLLMYPGVAGSQMFPSRQRFDGLILNRTALERFWEAYGGGKDLDGEPYAAPLHAQGLHGLPPAFVLLGGCDMLRDEGRAYAARLRDAGVDVDEICAPGQPHGFLNYGWPAAGPAYERIGAWVRGLPASGDRAAGRVP